MPATLAPVGVLKARDFTPSVPDSLSVAPSAIASRHVRFGRGRACPLDPADQPCEADRGGARWPDTRVARWQAFALLQTLNAEILASTSATRVLEAWCRAHHLAEEPRIVVERLHGQYGRWDPAREQWLKPRPGEVVTHRRVQLRCEGRILAEADNWYVASRLTAEVNRVLDNTDTPFGRAIAALDPYRRTMAVKILWSPLPEWRDDVPVSSSRDHGFAIPESLFEHRAVVYARDHTPVSFVEEVYKRSLLPSAHSGDGAR